MKLLIDFDSMIYLAIYKCVTINELRIYLRNHSKEIVREIVIQTALSRLENIVLNLLEDIENAGIDIDYQGIEYYLTSCSNNFRKNIDPEYKANRKPNKWVKELRNRAIELYDAKVSDTLEADDLIALRCKELAITDRIVVSSDKDLRQIAGLHYIYGNYKGVRFEYVEDLQAIKNLCTLMLVGDASDNIKGVKGIGAVKSDRLLRDKSIVGMLREVVKSYESKIKRKKNWKLTKII
jgi:5'-3' exonuclease